MNVENQLDELKKRYRNDEDYNTIQQSCIKLHRQDIITCNQILKRVIIDDIVRRMADEDEDFRELYERPMFGGSFYKNLKVGKPNEFDICLMINLCKSIDEESLQIEPDNNHPSYVKIRVHERKFDNNIKFWDKVLNRRNYLNQDRFRSWMQGIIDRTFRHYEEYHKGYMITLERRSERYYIERQQCGPAFTIHLAKFENNKLIVKIDFDLVPCLVFRNRFLEGFRNRTCEKWIAIAKPKNPATTWRAGFFNDEKKILAGQIKPIIRMVKKLRDVNNWEHLKSYFIETLFYHELDKQKNNYFANNYDKYPRTTIFIYMIGQLMRKLKSQKLFDYWHKKFNLFNAINESQLLEIAKKLHRIINDLDDGSKSLLDIFSG